MSESAVPTRSLWSGRPARGLIQRSPASPLDFSIYVNMRGAKDDVAGTYTGVSYGVVQNPADAIHFLLCVYGGIAEASIITSGFGSFVTARGELNDRVTWGVLNDFRIHFQQGVLTTLRQLIDRICSQTGLSFLEPIDGKYRVIAWTATPSGDDYIYRAVAGGGPVVFTWKDIKKLETPKFTPLSNVVNQVYINFCYEHGPNTLTKLTFVDEADSDPSATGIEALCAASQAAYGITNRLTLDADMLYQTATAVWLRNFAVWTLANPSFNLEFETGLWVGDMLPKQVFEFDSTFDTHLPYPIKASDGSWAGKQLRCEGIRRMQDAKSQIRYRIKATPV